jgi:uridine phosphorylase
MEQVIQHHIRCKKGDVGKYVFLPGDPGRVPLIAKYFDRSTKIAENREYVTYTGEVDSIPVSVTSTGIGCPAATIAVEELANIGAETFIRIGTCGGIDPSITGGEVIVPYAAVRGDGATREYMPIEYPAVADLDVANALVEGCRRVGREPRVGIVWTHDSFYRGTWIGWQPDLREVVAPWLKGGVLCVENEASGIFVVSRLRRKRAGVILVTGGNNLVMTPEREDLVKETLDKAIRAAIESVKILEKKEKQ